MKAEFSCEDCQSNNSYVDDQGKVCCSYCGTLSQQFFAESFEIEDGMAAVMNRGANRTKSRKKVKVATSTRALDGDILEFLSLYQYCLLLLLRFTLRAARLEGDQHHDDAPTVARVFDSYASMMKNIFTRYLLSWRDCRCSCSCCISDTFLKPSTSSSASKRARARYCTCDYSTSSTTSQKQRDDTENKVKCHPVPLSKSLLLGFVYLTFRLQRSWVVPADIVRWCESGLVPYNTLFEALPDSCKVDIIKENAAFFVSVVTGSVFICPGRILCLSESLIASLDIPMPPLNAPLVARSIIKQLGLPREVWLHYQSLAQLLLPACDGSAIDGAEAFGQHYTESIMAVITIACKCCYQWTHWALVKRLCGGNAACISSGAVLHEEEEFSMPISIAESALTPRYHLPMLLQRVQAIVPTPLWKQASLINGAIRTVLDRYRILQDSQSVDTSASLSLSKFRLHWNHFAVYDSSLKQRNIVMHHTALIYERLTTSERKVVNGLDAVTKPKYKGSVKLSTLKDYCSYISYARKSKSVVPGIYHMQHLALLERLARHLRCAPSLLHVLVDKLDNSIFVSEANLTTADPERISQLNNTKLSIKAYHFKMLDDVEKQFYAYKEYCDERFPIIRRLGSNPQKLKRKILKRLMLIPKNSQADYDEEFLDYLSNFDNHIQQVPGEKKIGRPKKQNSNKKGFEGLAMQATDFSSAESESCVDWEYGSRVGHIDSDGNDYDCDG